MKRYCENNIYRDVSKKMVKFSIEIKYSDTQPSNSLQYYAERLKPKRAIQLVYDVKKSFDQKGIRV